MTAQTTKMGPSPVSATTPPGNASTLSERPYSSVRPSTPDSGGLAPSDYDEDHSQIPSASTATPSPKAARRTSWLNKVPTNIPPKTSWATASHLSTANSSPIGSAMDQSGWPSNTGPALSSSMHWPHVGGGSLTWGTGIWDTESQKDSLRFSSALPKPSTVSNHFKDYSTSPTTRTTSGEWAIPFSIPLHPTPKACRSQSYSVGQLDPEYSALMARRAGGPYAANVPRNSGCQFSTLQHRSPRPGFLKDLSHDPATFSHLRGDVVGCGSPDGSESGMDYYTTNQARTIERLSRENALLRESAGQMEGSFRDRTMSTASAASGYVVGAGPGMHNWHRIRDSEEADLAMDDLDEVGDNPRYTNIHRNTRGLLSEHSIDPRNQYSNISARDSWGLQNLREAHWQTSLGFGSMAGIAQSRRHSLADIPIRQPSASDDSQAAAAARAGPPDRNELYASVGEGSLSNAPGQNQSSFVRDQALRAPNGPSAVPTSVHQAYATPNAPGRHGLGHSYHNQLLYIVTFKCHRADVFYIRKNTGLQVKSGDLVIVEADRGTDLGTVQHACVSMQRARELKQKYAEEHYEWLMIFSRQGQNIGANAVHAAGGMHDRSAIGMGLHGSHGIQDSVVDIKPKLIKRLAQNHEIRTLRDKESNEAKAKRVCQQKVAEHRLNMEILDAEFQMDWKKLTFYYFADSYINFNPLVADLFKIYKTRVWMSAINPRVVCQQYGEI